MITNSNNIPPLAWTASHITIHDSDVSPTAYNAIHRDTLHCDLNMLGLTPLVMYAHLSNSN